MVVGVLRLLQSGVPSRVKAAGLHASDPAGPEEPKLDMSWNNALRVMEIRQPFLAYP